LALSQQRFGEAEAALSRCDCSQPKLSIAYIGLGASEAAQHRYAEALSTFQKVTRMEPKAEIGWIAASGCAGKLGQPPGKYRVRQSATEIAQFFCAWSQLATAQRASATIAKRRSLKDEQTIAPTHKIVLALVIGAKLSSMKKTAIRQLPDRGYRKKCAVAASLCRSML